MNFNLTLGNGLFPITVTDSCWSSLISLDSTANSGLWESRPSLWAKLLNCPEQLMERIRTLNLEGDFVAPNLWDYTTAWKTDVLSTACRPSHTCRLVLSKLWMRAWTEHSTSRAWGRRRLSPRGLWREMHPRGLVLQRCYESWKKPTAFSFPFLLLLGICIETQPIPTYEYFLCLCFV